MNVIDSSTGAPVDTDDDHSASEITERLGRVPKAFEEWRARSRGCAPRSGLFGFLNRQTVWTE